MKKQLLPLFFLIYVIPGLLMAQGGTWVWMNGSQANNVLQSTAATQGHPSPFNTPRGLYEPAMWTDLAGNFWLFGGVPNLGFGTSDLWMYNPVTTEWTWVSGPGVTDQTGTYGVQGVPSPTNIPSARGWGCITWTDQNGDLWLFGGSARDSTGIYGRYNDLWRYNIEGAQWTWMSGTGYSNQPANYGAMGVPDPNNVPTGRDETNCGWVDANNNLWLFGGFDSIGGLLNDMWKYDISTNMWAWMKGAQHANDTGSHGIMGVESPSNNPSGRACYAHWKDSLGNFYIYAGGDVHGLENDVWKFNPITNNWTWVAGPRTPWDTGDFHYPCQWKGRPDARTENRTPAPFGCSNNFIAYFTDVWMFNSDSLKWKMLREANDTTHFGIRRLPSPENFPPARSGSATWLDKNSNLWVFGGIGGAGAGYAYGHLNDMWEFIPNASCAGVSPFTGNIHYQLQQNAICQGSSTQVTVSVPYTQIYPPGDVSWIDSTHALLSPSGTTLYQIIGSTVCIGNDTTSFLLTVNQPGSLNYQLSSSAICQGASATITILNETQIQISPTSGVSWLDSTTALLTPGADITYTITGQSTLCPSTDQAQVYINVDQQNAIILGIPNDTVMCAGGTIYANTSGLNSIEVIATYTPNGGSSVWVTSPNQIQFTPARSDTFYLSGYSNCGDFYNDTVVIRVETPGVLDYNLPNRELCLGDSSLLTITNCTSATITPTIGVRWLNATSAILKPLANTVYHVVGPASNTNCGAIDSANINIRVMQPGQVNYSLSRPVACSSAYDTIFVYGLKNVTINPSWPIVYIDSFNSYIVVAESGTTNFTITGQSICGQRDSSVITIPEADRQLVTLSNIYVCVGDSSMFTIGHGVTGFQISPQTYLTWIDSAHILIIPDTTITYTITGVTCQGFQTISYPVPVDRPGIVNSTLVPAPAYCHSGGTQLFFVEGLLNPVFTPALPTHMIDSIDYSFYFTLDSSVTYTLIGRSVCGGWDTARYPINVLPYPSYALSKPDICLGDSTTLTLTGLYNLNISPAGNLAWIDSSANLSHAWLFPDTTTTFTVTGLSCFGLETYHVKVNAITPGRLNYTIANTVTCVGSYVDVDLTGITGAQITPNGYNLLWTDSTDAIARIFVNSFPGTYPYVLTAQSICGETDTARFNIIAQHLPNYPPYNTIICHGDSMALTLTGYSGAVITPANGVTWIDTAHVKLSPDTTTYYVLTGTSCQGHTQSGFHVMVVNPGIITYTLGDTVICPGDSTLLTIYGLQNGNGVQVSPFVQLGMTGSSEQLGYVVPTATTTYQITGPSICGGNDTGYFTVHLLPAPAYIYTQPAFCNGDSGTVTFQGISGVTFWPNTGVNWADSTHATLNPGATTTYQFSGSTTCTGTYTGTITVTLNQPTATITGDTLVCHGDSARICATPGFAAYRWNSGQTTACIEAPLATTYQVTVTDTGGCTAVSNAITLAIRTSPPVSVSNSNDTMWAHGGISQQWLLNGNPITGATANMYVALVSGEYSVQITDSNGCTATSKIITISVGIDDINADNIKVYPNPLGTGYWNVDVTEDLLQSHLAIYDDRGRLIYTSEIHNLHSEIMLNAAQGVYLLRISSPGIVIAKKLVKL